jgi:hypothetical protein
VISDLYHVRGWRRALTAVAALLLLGLGVTGLLGLIVLVLAGTAGSGEPEPWGDVGRRLATVSFLAALSILTGALLLRWAVRPQSPALEDSTRDSGPAV